MNATHMAQNAYGKAAHPIKTNRDIEYGAFAKVTTKMKTAEARGMAHFADLVAAVQENRNLWLLLVLDIADKDNPLPSDLKARIMFLAQFTEMHSRRVLRDAAALTPLIDINAAVMAGLHTRGSAT
ncbi:flagellar biosynthesis regulator FlaF [Roseovarius carneus]|uniref:flagellar biosynthesis regulator FlaF n=1 Tax=Roseovarius carneus TaxID=2853164 RepID=UPI001CCDDDDB|nr:flagellar biosynthesis regulator FlaF [Roseovarius carneus]